MDDREWCLKRAAADGLPARDMIVPPAELARVRARGWTRAEGLLPDGSPQTLIKIGDRELQAELIARNVGEH